MKLHSIKIKIGDLFKFLNLDNEILESEQFSDKKIYIKNLNNEIVPILGYVKKQVNLYKYFLSSGKTIVCSDKHIVLDKNFDNILISKTKELQTLEGLDYIVASKLIEENGFAYDIAIPSPHLYYTTNGIIHHNTTITKILAKPYTDVLEINASAERGIDTIRESIIGFASSLSLMDGKQKTKIVILEECDGFTNDAWMAMRATMEKFHKNVRFIANCNYPEKIPAPILSRFNVIPLYPINNEEENYLIEEYSKRIGAILTKLQIEYTDEILKEFIKMDFPDMRTLLNKVQSLFNRGERVLSRESLNGNFDFESLFKISITSSNPWDNYKVVVGEWSNKVDECILAFGKDFPEYLRINLPDKISKLPLVIIAIAEHAAQLNQVPDKMVTLLSLIYKIQIILSN